MHMFHPPLSRLELICQENKDQETNFIELTVDGKRFLRAGFIVDQLRSHWFTCPNCPIGTHNENHTKFKEAASWSFRERSDFYAVESDITGWALLEEMENPT